ncbi:MAG: hypothetical protein ABIP75_04355 [Pyrinomonadaceae bacterium]
MRKTIRSCFLSIALITVFSTQLPAQSRTTTPARERVWAEGSTAAEVTVTLSEAFLNSFFEAVFTNLQKPSYPLSLIGGTAPPAVAGPKGSNAAVTAQCPSQIVLEREVSGVKTEIHFRDGRIEAPLAFSGTYPLAIIGCIEFTGWADATVALSFDQGRQLLSGRVSVAQVHLSGVPNLTSGVITRYVQSSLDSKINPVEILRAEQLSAAIPVKPAGGSLRLRAREVRPEIAPGELRLRISYEFVKGD